VPEPKAGMSVEQRAKSVEQKAESQEQKQLIEITSILLVRTVDVRKGFLGKNVGLGAGSKPGNGPGN
jgi:hypothetical protein